MQAILDILSTMFNVLFISSIINMLTNNKSAKLSVAELFKMNQLLFFPLTLADGRLLVLWLTRWISLNQDYLRRMKIRRCQWTEAEKSRDLSGQG